MCTGFPDTDPSSIPVEVSLSALSLQPESPIWSSLLYAIKYLMTSKQDHFHNLIVHTYKCKDIH